MTDHGRFGRLVIVFGRYPEPGATKTRLIPAIGPEEAARTQHEMTELLLARLDALQARGIEIEMCWGGGNLHRMQALYGARRRYVAQTGGNLGERMLSAFERTLAEAGRVVLVGSDCPQLESEHVEDALVRLDSADVVIGPALDGGYYLIAMRRPHRALFEGIEWSTPTVLAQTLERADRRGMSVSCLRPLGDVDEPSDLSRWARVRKKAKRDGFEFSDPAIR